MPEWLWQFQNQMAINHALLQGGMFQCPVATPLRWFTYALVAIWLVKVLSRAAGDRRLRHYALPYPANAHARVWRAYRRATRHARLRSLPPLFESRDRRFPAFAIGILRPAVFLDPRFAERLEDDELEAVLTHELFHIKRRDNLRAWLLDLGSATIPLWMVQIFGIHFASNSALTYGVLILTPLAVLLSRTWLLDRFCLRREYACDAMAARRTGSPLALASALAKTWRLLEQRRGRPLARVQHPSGYPLFTGRGSVERRIRRLMARPSMVLDALRVWGLRLALTLGVGLMGAFLWQYHVDGLYDGTLAACHKAACAMFSR